MDATRKHEKKDVNNTEIDIHNRDSRLKSAYRLLSESNTCEENKELILEFTEHKKTAQHIGKLRESKTVRTLRILAEVWGKPFTTLKPARRTEENIIESRKNLEKLLNKAYNRDVVIKSPVTDEITRKNKPSLNTCKDYFIFLKMFYSWMVGRNHPEEFDMLRIPKPKVNKPKVSELLTPEDIKKLSAAATNPRDRLIPQILWDSGGRVEEITSLRIGDIEPVNDGEYYKLYLNKSKKDSTGEEAIRTILVDDSAPALVQWLNHHPLGGDKNAPLFVSLNNHHPYMIYDNIRKVLLTLKKRSGLEKKVNPHFFRKSITSYLRSKKKMNDASLKTRHGWKPSSDMLDVYASEDQEEANKDYLRAKGKIKAINKNEDTIQPAVCKYCNTRNPIGVDYCITCKRPLNLTKEEKNLKVVVEDRISELIKEKVFKEHPKVVSDILEGLKREGF